ncbi:putative Ig domain-containing protein [Bowmanella yangjiangensis]|uniref:Ig domain-containing protein n=1 Tax=Bowmanella yangjiangensis TaxID=2811230 RepID=A0ABS3CP22_9ALTE|nr:putative Ig domain-containing protein [Bowmanella yangjiangensis]MBN7818279.1 putative Ig domain-containing protein [Bowmanella yangjiangensis]
MKKLLTIGLVSLLSACGSDSSHSPATEPDAANSPPIVSLSGPELAASGHKVVLQLQAEDKDGQISAIKWAQTQGPQLALQSTELTMQQQLNLPQLAQQTEFSFSVTVRDDKNAEVVVAHSFTALPAALAITYQLTLTTPDGTPLSNQEIWIGQPPSWTAYHTDAQGQLQIDDMADTQALIKIAKAGYNTYLAPLKQELSEAFTLINIELQPVQTQLTFDGGQAQQLRAENGLQLNIPANAWQVEGTTKGNELLMADISQNPDLPALQFANAPSQVTNLSFSTQQGSPLSLKPGQFVSVTFPYQEDDEDLLSSLVEGQPIVLSSLNEQNGQWQEEVTGTLQRDQQSPSGWSVTADLPHFSYWGFGQFNHWVIGPTDPAGLYCVDYHKLYAGVQSLCTRANGEWLVPLIAPLKARYCIERRIKTGLDANGNAIWGTEVDCYGEHSFQSQDMHGRTGYVSTVEAGVTALAPESKLIISHQKLARLGQTYFNRLETLGISSQGRQYQVLNGSLPTGLQFEQNAIRGTPQTLQPEQSLLVQVSDAFGNQAQASLQLGVAPPFVASNIPAEHKILTGSNLSLNLTPSSGLSPYLFTLVNPDNGMQLDPSSGQFSFSTAQKGQYLPYMVVCEQQADACRDDLGQTNYRPMISVYEPAVLGFSELPSGRLTQSYEFTLVYNQSDDRFIFADPVHNWQVSGLPVGLSLQSRTKLQNFKQLEYWVIAGTPEQSGEFEVTINLTTELDGTIALTSPLLIRSIAPEISGTLPASLNLGEPMSLALQTLQGSVLTWRLASGSMPTGLILNSQTGVISGTPQSAGFYSFVVEGEDAAGQVASLSLATQVIQPLLPPSLSGSPGNAMVNQPFSFSLTNQGGAVSAWQLQGTLPSGLNHQNGTLSGTPTVSGSYPLQFTASNGAGSSSHNVTLVVQPTPPALGGQLPGQILTNQIFSFVPSNSGGQAASWSVSQGSLPTGLSLNTQSGEISGTPTQPGNHFVVIAATNGGGSDTLALTFTIVDGNLPQLSLSMDPVFFINQAIGVQPINSGGHVDTWSINAALPAGLSFNPSNGQITGSTATDGDVQVEVSAANQFGTDTLSFTLRILGVPAQIQQLSAVGSDGLIDINWQAVAPRHAAETIGYRLYLADDASLNSSNYQGLPQGQMLDNLTGTHQQIQLTNGSARYALVVAYNLAGQGQDSPLAYATAQQTQNLNLRDSGYLLCANDDDSMAGGLSQLACSTDPNSNVVQGQDGLTGADAKGQQTPSDSFTKLDSQGNALAQQNQDWDDNGSEAAGSQWSCWRDDVTGLVWQVKPGADGIVGNAGLHDGDNLYAVNATNSDPLNCHSDSQCNLTSYIKVTNQQSLCGLSNWRLPALNELMSIADMQHGSLLFTPPALASGSPLPLPIGSDSLFAVADIPYFSQQPNSQALDLRTYTLVQDTNLSQRSVLLVSGAPPSLYAQATNAQPQIDGSQVCDNLLPSTAASDRFQIIGDGTLLDSYTNLMWRRCALGYDFDDATQQCVLSGAAQSFSWIEGLAQVASFNDRVDGTNHNHSDWRMPNAKEMQSLTEWRCNVRMNMAVFASPVQTMWTATPWSGIAPYTQTHQSLMFDSSDGSLKRADRTDMLAMMLVRDNVSPNNLLSQLNLPLSTQGFEAANVSIHVQSQVATWQMLQPMSPQPASTALHLDPQSLGALTWSIGSDFTPLQTPAENPLLGTIDFDGQGNPVAGPAITPNFILRHNNTGTLYKLALFIQLASNEDPYRILDDSVIYQCAGNDIASCP